MMKSCKLFCLACMLVWNSPLCADMDVAGDLSLGCSTGHSEGVGPQFVGDGLGFFAALPESLMCSNCLRQTSNEEVEVTDSKSSLRVLDGVLDIPAVIDGCETRAIRRRAFAGNLAIKEVHIPATVAWIEDDAFAGCSNIVEVVMHQGELSDARYFDGVGAIHSGAFRDCVSLTNVVFSSNVGRIYEDAFYGCSALSDITLPEFTFLVCGSAFDGCINLRKLHLARACERMLYCFEGCPGLEEITVSKDNWMYIVCDGALYRKDLIEFMRLPPRSPHDMFTVRDGVKVIGPFAFEDCRITSVDLPDGLVAIGTGAFMNCTSLVSVIMPQSLERIDSRAFSGCSNLVEVVFCGERMPEVGEDALPRQAKPVVCKTRIPMNASKSSRSGSAAQTAVKE